MDYTSDQSIIAASLLILDKHLRDDKRPIRALVDADFQRIRSAKKKVARRWYVDRHATGANYPIMRSQMLDGWMRKHKWDIRTRNLYSSILAKLTVWEQHGIKDSDKQRLQQLEPGAQLFLQFLKTHQKMLI